MKKFVALLILLLVFAGRSDAVQINKKALGSIDDIVKEVTKGNLEIPKKSLLFVELHNLDYKYETGKKRKDPYSSVSSYLVPYIFTISSDASLAKTFKQPVIHTENSEDYLLLKHDSRRIFQTVLSAVSQNFNVMYQISSLTQNFLNGFYNIKRENNSISSSSLTKKKDTSPAKKYANIFDMVSVPVKGYDNDVFAAVYTSESSDVARVILYEVDGDSWSVISELKTAPNNVELASLAVGDFDDDGFKNELALIVNSKTEIILYVYRFVYSGGKLQVKMLGSAEGYKILETGSNQAFADSAPLQAASQVLAGDYDGDGQDEIAVVFRDTVHNTADKSKEKTVIGNINVTIYKWNKNGGYDSKNSNVSYNYYEYKNFLHVWQYAGVAGLRAVTADLEGDGKDEIVTLIVGFSQYLDTWSDQYISGRTRKFQYYPYLINWYCDKGTIIPKHDDKHIKGGGVEYGGKLNTGGKLLLGENVWEFYESYSGTRRTRLVGSDHPKERFVPEKFSLVAGAFTGTVGAVKTVDDIALGWCWGVHRKVYVFKTAVKDGAFDGFGDAVKIYQNSTLDVDDSIKDKDSYQRTGDNKVVLVAADFAGEGVELGNPIHVVNKSDISYAAIIQAPPYHVDTIDVTGKKIQKAPTNFTFSEGRGGHMSTSYVTSETKTENKTLSFNMQTAVETIYLIDSKATRTVAGGARKITKLVANVLNFAGKDKVGNSITGILNKFLDKTTKVTNGTESNISKVTVEDKIKATANDALLYYRADQHIWRYPILSNPVPSWLFGARIDNDSGDQTGNNATSYITFSLYDDLVKGSTASVNTNTYQPLHEEGNFFSYPPNVADSEGYNPAGVLTNPLERAFSHGTEYSTSSAFEKSVNNEQSTRQTTETSIITETVSLLDRIAGGEKIGIKSLVPQAGNPETFKTSYSKNEKILLEFQARSGELVQAAGHTLKFAAYISKVKAMAIGAAVELAETATLWTNSLYTQFPDPSLILPQKFITSGKAGVDFVVNPNEKTATLLRGMRFFLPEYLFYTDNRLVNGETYKIRVPLYNASFKDSGNFTVRLSYASDNTAKAAKTAIATTTLSLGKWDNTKNNNKGWADFNWTPNLKAGKYYFYVEIDPENKLKEVHEAKSAADPGGNNTGFYPFSIFDADGKNYKAGQTDLKVKGSLYTAGISKFSGSTAHDVPDEVNVTVKFNGSENLKDLQDYLDKASKDYGADEIVPISCDIQYEGEYNFPYIDIYGFNLKPGIYDKKVGNNFSDLIDDDIDSYFMHHSTSMFTGEQGEFTFMVSPSMVDLDNGIIFILSIPYEAVAEDETLSGEDPLSISYFDDAETNTDTDIYNNITSSSGGGCMLMQFSWILILAFFIKFVR